MSASKPTCPDCGSESVNALYSGVTVIQGDGTIAVGGVAGGAPIEWDCSECGAVERTDHLSLIGEQVYEYWCVAKGAHILESGYEWSV